MSQAAERTIQENVLTKSVPVHRTDTTFDASFSTQKDKFSAEMKKMDDEMTKFSNDLKNVYDQGTTIAAAQGSTFWDTIANSPLIQSEGNDRLLKLQYDLTQFDPAEVRVQVNQDTLIVTANHQEQSDTRSVVRRFKRDFLLPRGIDLNAIISSLSRDGVLTVQIPLPKLEGLSSDAKVPKTQKATTDLKAPPRSAEEAKNPQSPGAQVPQSPLSSLSPVAPNLQTPRSPRSPDREPSKVTSKINKK